MKFLDKLNLIMFSVIILIISLLICIASFGWIDIQMVESGIGTAIWGEKIGTVTLVIAILLILASAKSIFFNSFIGKDESSKDGILLENDNGKLLVSRDTIESLANTVVKSFESAETVATKVNVDKENNIRVFITLFVNPDAIIKDLSSKLQINVKDAIKKSLDLDVKEVNIKVKNIDVKKEQIKKE